MQTPEDPRMRLVDAASNDELVELGIAVRPKARICRECRFWIRGERDSYCSGDDRDYDQCQAMRKGYCNELNPKGNCELWEPKSPKVPGDMAIGLLLGTTFGGAVMGVLWLLAGGG